MKHVSWPTRRQVVAYTVVVIGISLITAFYLGLLDYLFTAIVQRII
ncbi:MAG: Preprotein translocase, SecE subunit [Candidatus Adlerbacteria bacterium GW2011_GWA2_54_12]|nr:MAG: Preprotein translocase, SecE subunit [Candidatus Adlerbacteria bacterium GW2011_GWA1_54_10]KKW36290.1 MAG: Preprotein translocase, SecE subunit [Candidatus Adlerbacteria bacterium GW2011_GWA2_54_12]KKW37820.1 MAG: Preprotein translocase, SecE subunit [Candidatus Adlerbacteria bacterium GW2011_GWB1_54_7]